MRRTRVAALGVSAFLALGAAQTAFAHDFQPGVVAFREVGNGSYLFALSDPVTTTGLFGRPLELDFPPGCHRNQTTVSCGPDGLRGELRVRGAPTGVPVLVSVTSASGAHEEHVLSGSDARVSLGGTGPASLWAWLRMGIHHVLTGFDHLAFVVGMVFVARGARRKLLLTVTSFTLAHSLTLALAMKGVVQLPSLAVEACIAASVVLLAREALVARDTWTRRWPWAVSFAFGLVHGLGFAGVLARIGLPEGAWMAPLALFNLGIELGQLAVVAATLALSYVQWGRIRPELTARVLLTSVGGLGAFWFIERTLSVMASR